jgi:hypothetical protein
MESMYEPMAFAKVAENRICTAVAVNGKGGGGQRETKGRKLVFNLMTGKGAANTFTGIADVYCERDVPGLSNGDSVRIRALFVNNPGGMNRPYLVAKEVLVTKSEMDGK